MSLLCSLAHLRPPPLFKNSGSAPVFNIELVEIFIPTVSASFAICQNWFESWFKLAYLCITWLSRA